MKLPVSWLRDFVQFDADPPGVAARLASCGFAVEGLEQDVIDLEVTANRPDCLSVRGLSREAAVAFDTPLKEIPPARPTPAGAPAIPVSLDDPGCARYALAVAEVVVGPSPEWMAARLLAAGVRPINNIVDVTNYVMLEMGQPLHAFDAEKLAGPEIRVRRARPNERLTTLDGEVRALDDDMLVIADHDRAVAVAGVMGGTVSEVSVATTRVAIESAWFRPASVRATSRKLGLKTDAAIRFERGADVAAPVAALQRALTLLADIDAGVAVSGIVDQYPHAAEASPVLLRRARVAHLLGESVPDREITRILETLGFALESTADGWRVGVPSFRIDVAREADLIEEVGRHWGFDRIPATLPPLRQPPPTRAIRSTEEDRLRSLACGTGLQEAVTFTFIERAAAEPFLQTGEPAVAIANPLSEKFAVLRPSLLPGLLDALVYNRHRESDAVRLFELGSVFRSSREARRIGWVLTGHGLEHWSGSGRPADFFDTKGIAELLVASFGVSPDDVTTVSADELPWFVRGRSAVLRVGGRPDSQSVGHVGQLRPELVAARGLDSEVVLGGEVDLDAFAPHDEHQSRTVQLVQPIPRFPSIVRDLSIVIPTRLPATEVRGTIRSNAPSTLAAVSEFDRYQGKGVAEGRVSLSVRLTFRATDRTLTDVEVQEAVDEIVSALRQEHGAELRGR